MGGLVISFSGRIGSGKTSITQTLAGLLEWPRTGFGDYLRARIAREGGDPNSREALQDLGQKLVDADSERFCRDVLSVARFEPGGFLLLDGVRHVDIQKCVSRLVVPSRSMLIHIAIDDSEVRKRVQSRLESDDEIARAA
jgi:adenylate kinase family enzyme